MHVTHKYLFNNNTVYINQYFERSHLSPACIQCSCMATSNRIIMSAKPTQRFKCRYIRFPSLSLSTCLVSICSQHSVLVTGDSRSNLCEYCLHIHTHLYTYVFVRLKKSSIIMFIYVLKVAFLHLCIYLCWCLRVCDKLVSVHLAVNKLLAFHILFTMCSEVCTYKLTHAVTHLNVTSR